MKKLSIILIAISLFFVINVSGILADDSPLPKSRVWRYYNTISGEHLYTADPNEEDQLGIATVGNSQRLLWQFEGTRFVNEEGNRPVYRLLNPNTGEHLYTPDLNELEQLLKIGWECDFGERPAFYVMLEPQEGVTDTRPAIDVHRLYNPRGTAVSAHLLSENPTEIEALKQLGYRDEGHLFYSLEPASFGFTD